MTPLHASPNSHGRPGRWAVPLIGMIVGAASAMFGPTRAQASDEVYGGGLFIGYNMGKSSGFAWGAEAFMTHRFEGTGMCVAEEQHGVGPLLQFSMTGLADPRVTLAVQGATEWSRQLGAGIVGELGLTYRGGASPGFGIHTGITPVASLLYATLRHQWLLGDTFVGGGIRIRPVLGMPGACGPA